MNNETDMKAIRYIAFILLLPLLLTTCMREPFPEMANGSDGWLLTFSAPPAPEIVVSTKGTMTDSNSEYDVYNLYVLVFDLAGNKIWGQEFTWDNKVDDTPNDDGEWSYTNSTRTGTVFLRSAKSSEANSKECKIVIIANLNSEMVNVTPAQLQGVANWTAMCNVQATLLQKITSRSGYFPMYGELNKVNLWGDTLAFDPNEGSTLNLSRLDARIKFNVKADANPTYGIQDFVPLTWQLFNVPVVSSVTGSVNVATEATQFFDGLETNFETETRPSSSAEYPTYTGSGKEACTHGFSFYMMENVKAPKSTPAQGWEYKDRDKQVKETDGRNKVDTNNKPVFQYANDLATYVVLKGRLIINKDSEIKHAEVQYVIHLGDFKNDLGDFSILRNHSYTYNITIQGVSQIRVEVESKTENEPGASGQIVVPVKKIFTCDSHYSTHVVDFYYQDLVDYGLSWWVRTPFNSDGYKSDANGQVPATDHVDSGWVEFRVNEKDGTGHYPANTWTLYKPRKDSPADTAGEGDTNTMNIAQLMAFLKTEMGKYEAGQASAFDGEKTGENPSLNPKITVTAFVNEYYYETDPDGESRTVQERMRMFVNQPMRTLCIMTSGDVSYDRESVVEKAAYIFQQYSIQSPYNVNTVQSGWGCEYFTDDREAQCNGNSTTETYWTNANKDKRKNWDSENGRWDTMIEWGLRTADDPTFNPPVGNPGKKLEWADFLNLTEENNGIPYMRTSPNYKHLRHTCMSRNRDNNGDGVIDKDEVRWYMAASDQLIGLFLGSYGIEGDAKLYNVSPKDRETGAWRQHVLASNSVNNSEYSNRDVRIVWAEECLSGSDMRYNNSNGTTQMSVRCLRNIGFDPDGNTHGGDITYSDEGEPNDPKHKPQPLITMEAKTLDNSGNVVDYTGNWTDMNKYRYAFFDVDCSNVNDRSLRYYTDRELAWHDENSEAACLYKHFRTATIAESIVFENNTKYNIRQLNQLVGGHVKYCPDGYRLPNVRELGIMCYFYDQDIVKTFLDGRLVFTRTYFSFGPEGKTDRSGSSHWGWGFGWKDNRFRVFMATVGNSAPNTGSPRCVKDIK